MKKILKGFLAFALVSLTAVAARQVLAATTVTVTPNDLALPASPTTVSESWYFWNDTTDTGSDTESPNYQFTVGPDTPALGVGSVSFELTGGLERWNLATNQFAGTNLADLSAMSFDMYTPADSTGGTSTTLFLNFDVDFDSTVAGTGNPAQDATLPFFPYQHRLVYLPQQNGTPTLDTWETWDAFADDALWGWSRYAANGNMWPDGNTTEYRTKADLLAAFPNLAVWNESAAGQFLIRAGHPGPVGLKGSVDNIVVGDTTFDFEPLVGPPASKDECKEGGWMSFNNPTFKNQGDCVSYVQSSPNAKGNK